MKIGEQYIPPYILRDFLDENAKIVMLDGWKSCKSIDGLWVYNETHGSIFLAEHSSHYKIIGLLMCSSASIREIIKTIGAAQHFIMPELWLAGIIGIEYAGSTALPLSTESDRFKWFELYLKRYSGINISSKGMLNRLKEAKVCIIGIGGLGSSLAVSLAASGVGTLTLVDGDKVENSNLTRQLFYVENDVGQMKVDCLERCIRANNSNIKVVCFPNFVDSDKSAVSVIRGSDLVVLCADTPRFKIRGWVGKACLDNLIPHIAMAGHWVGPLSVPFRSPCHICIARLHGASIADARGLVSSLSDRNAPPRGSFGPRPLILAGHISSLILHYLTGIDQETPLDRRYGIGLFGDIMEEKMVRYKDCLSCGQRDDPVVSVESNG